MIGAFFAVYVAVTALSLPGAAIMTLLAGAIFGLWVGTLVVSFASSIGATLAMLVSRYVLRDSVKAKFGARLADIDRGIERDGAFYLFTLRLVPVFPFFVINLLMGLTAMKAAHLLLGQPARHAGRHAGVRERRHAAGADQLAAGHPVAGADRLVRAARAVPAGGQEDRRRGAGAARSTRSGPQRKPKRFDRNLVVIGAGAAGLVTSYIAAAVKAKVTLVESHKMGGDCLNYGCVPSKALIKTATLARQMRHSADYGIASAEFKLDFAQVMERVARVIADIEPHDSVERYTGLGVDVVEGTRDDRRPVAREDRARQRRRADAHHPQHRHRHRRARPSCRRCPGWTRWATCTSDTLWDLRELPARLVVLGGGPIGCELAQAFARLGSQVTQVEMAPRLMIREDEEVSAYARKALEADGVAVLTGHKALRCEKVGDDKFIVVEAGGQEKRIGFDLLLCAVGRVARLQGFGLEELGIPVEPHGADQRVPADDLPQHPGRRRRGRALPVHPHRRAPGLVCGGQRLFGGFKKFKADYSVIPWCTFIDPEVARVGLNEQEAKEQGVAYEVTRYGIDDLDRAIADSAAHGWVKVLTVPGKDRILGVTIVGAHAGDLLAEYVLAMKHGLGLNKILGTIHTYPTLAEANKYAAGEWKRAHQPHGLLKWVQRFHDWQTR